MEVKCLPTGWGVGGGEVVGFEGEKTNHADLQRARKETIPNGVWEKTFSLYDLRWQRKVVSRI